MIHAKIYLRSDEGEVEHQENGDRKQIQLGHGDDYFGRENLKN